MDRVELSDLHEIQRTVIRAGRLLAMAGVIRAGRLLAMAGITSALLIGTSIFMSLKKKPEV
jgi:hypothetical protein